MVDCPMNKLFALAVVTLAFPGAAYAQSCQTPQGVGATDAQISCGSGGVPQISGLTGSVSLLRDGRIVPVESGLQLVVGDRLISRSQSGANVTLGGTCSASILANSTTTITRSGNLTCVSQRAMAPANQVVEPIAQAPSAPSAGTIAPVVTPGVSPLVLAIGGSALVGAAGIAISQSSDKNRLSP